MSLPDEFASQLQRKVAQCQMDWRSPAVAAAVVRNSDLAWWSGDQTRPER